MANIAYENEYSDIDFVYKLNPTTGDISTKTGINAVKQSVLNILRTNHGERINNPTFGANLRAYLFEPINKITATMISTAIKLAIANSEPRVNVLNVNIRSNHDRHRINITLTIQIISTNQTVDIATTLERLR